MTIMGISPSGVADKAKQYKENIKDTLKTKVKPFVQDNYAKAKTTTKDVIEFAKKNPKKVGKMAAVGLLIASAAALVVSAVKDFINTKKQNKILTKWVITQRETIDDLKEIAAANNDTIAAQHKIIEDLKA